MTQEQAVRALRLIEDGLEPTRACVSVGISANEAERWVADSANAEAIRAAETKAEVALLAAAKRSGGAGARWLMERRWPERYSAGAMRTRVVRKDPEIVQGGPSAGSAHARAQERRAAGRARLSLVPVGKAD